MKSACLIFFAVVISIANGCTSLPKENISGTWSASFGETTMLIQLDKNEHWKWWDTRESPPPKPPSQEGRWFIHDGILVLRLEKSESDKLPVGLAFTFDVRKVSADRLTLYNLQMEKEEYWERTAEPIPQDLPSVGKSATGLRWEAVSAGMILTRNFRPLVGSFQYSYLFSGEANGRQILFRTEGGQCSRN